MRAFAYLMMAISMVFLIVGIPYWWHLRQKRIGRNKQAFREKTRNFHSLKRKLK